MAVERISDIMLSDILTPVKGGTETENSSGNIPVVILTARFNPHAGISGNHANSNAFLLIPFDAIDLHSVLRNLIGIKRTLQEENFSVTLSEITSRTVQSQADQFIRKITCLIDANIDNDRFGVDEICKTIGMSRAQIYRKFKSLTGLTPYNYLRSYRLQKAKQFMLTTKLNVSEAAYRTGFRNVSHFSRIFTREFKKHPSEISR